MGPSFKKEQTLLSSLKLELSKLNWFTFFIAIFIYTVGKNGAIVSYILRYKKGQAKTK